VTDRQRRVLSWILYGTALVCALIFVARYFQTGSPVPHLAFCFGPAALAAALAARVLQIRAPSIAPVCRRCREGLVPGDPVCQYCGAPTP